MNHTSKEAQGIRPFRSNMLGPASIEDPMRHWYWREVGPLYTPHETTERPLPGEKADTKDVTVDLLMQELTDLMNRSSVVWNALNNIGLEEFLKLENDQIIPFFIRKTQLGAGKEFTENELRDNKTALQSRKLTEDAKLLLKRIATIHSRIQSVYNQFVRRVRTIKNRAGLGVNEKITLGALFRILSNPLIKFPQRVNRALQRPQNWFQRHLNRFVEDYRGSLNR